MSLSSSFQLISFQRKVDDALRSVERTLELERNPRLAADVDHTYGAKYGLVDSTSNASIIAYVNCLDKLGLDAAALKSIDKTKPATLRFDSSATWKFVKEVIVDVPVKTSYEEKEETTSGDASKNTTKTRVMKAVQHITEYLWEVEVNWSISIYSGTSVEDKRVIKSRACKTNLITHTKEGMVSTAALPPIELSLTWLMQQIDTDELNSQFRVETEDVETKTPRRNGAVQEALGFAEQLGGWCRKIEGSFLFGQVKQILQMHDPVLLEPHTFNLGQLSGIERQYPVFNPILPLMDETSDRGEVGEAEIKSIIKLRSSDDEGHKALLSPNDVSKLLNEHVRTLEGAVRELEASWPSDTGDSILSSSEATLSLICTVLKDLSTRYDESMSYIESMMENQLIAAIGKRLTPLDLDKFVKFYNAKLLRPTPRPFSHAIRRPEHYPVGLLSIESDDGERECIHSHSREVVPVSNLKIPLSAATVLELTGQQHLHGYMNHRFGTSNKRHQLIARARQFSAFILVIGNMTDGSTLDPKDAIIVQNKDELVIPLLLDELPTAKEFKDAVKSLSPEQQRFARAYRKMQLASSVFALCVVQIKPQLEALLGLPEDSLDKEMKLTQDLMELFIEYQVPSDLLSYNGFSGNADVEDKISNVRDNVKGVLDVVNAEKEKQLKMEQTKTDMAMEKTFRRAAATDFEMRLKKKKKAEPKTKMALKCRSEAPNSRSRVFSMKSSVSRNVAGSTKREASEIQTQQPPQGEERRTRTSSTNDGQSKQPSDEGFDFTLIPQILDVAVEKSGEDSALRSTTVKTGDVWTRNRQENLLTEPKRQTLTVSEVKKEKNKAFDLLDALGRSGSLPIAYNELHVLVAVTHCFDKDVMSTVVCDNVNPIEKLECSTLLLASAVHGVPARELVADVCELRRLEGSLPSLVRPAEQE